jgi:hypothetical protein
MHVKKQHGLAESQEGNPITIHNKPTPLSLLMRSYAVVKTPWGGFAPVGLAQRDG